MASRGDVKAGSAYVALGTDDSKLVRGLKAGIARVQAFAAQANAVIDQVGAFGRRAALFGAAWTTSMVAIAKGFADSGAEMAKMRRQTGLSASALSALARAAADNDVSLEAVGKAMTALQKATVGGGADVEEALGRIGLSLDDLGELTPDASLAAIADGLSRIQDEALRTDTAAKLLGRSGPELLAMFKDGAAGLRAAGIAAQRAGEAFTEAMLDAAEKLDDAFDALAGSTKGLRNALGEALTPALGPVVNALSSAVERVTAWTKQNPELARGVLGLAVGVTALGTATWGLAAAIGGVVAAATALAAILTVVAAPLVAIGALATLVFVQAIAAIAGLAAVALAVTDALGVTSSGFGDLFNSIRVGGQGLATWYGKFWTYLAEGFEHLWFNLSSGFDFVWTAARIAARGIYDAFDVVTTLLGAQFEALFGGLATAFELVFGLAVATAKSIAKTIGGALTVTRLVAVKKLDDLEARATGERETFSKRQEKRSKERDEAVTKLRAQRAELDKKDPNDGTTLDFDAERAKKGLVGIGNSITGAIKAVFDRVLPDQKVSKRDDSLFGRFIGAGFEVGSAAGGPLLAAGLASSLAVAATTVTAIAEQVSTEKARAASESEDAGERPAEGARAEDGEVERSGVDALGTFNADVADRLGFGTGLEERQTRAAEETAKNTRGLRDVLGETFTSALERALAAVGGIDGADGRSASFGITPADFPGFGSAVDSANRGFAAARLATESVRRFDPIDRMVGGRRRGGGALFGGGDAGGGAGSSAAIDDRVARATEATARNTRQLLDAIQRGDGGAVFG